MSNAAELARAAPAQGWLRNERFDIILILGVALLALAIGISTSLNPQSLPFIIFVNLWLLGYHHVISTFTRLAFDAPSRRENAFLLYGLPWIVLAAVVALAVGVGFWTVASIYFYWQWFHYTRQSWGIHRAYERKAGADASTPTLDMFLFYAVPVAGVIARSAQNPDTFLGMEINFLPMPAIVPTAATAMALAAVAFWLLRQVQRIRRGETSIASSMYMATHLLVFGVAYLLIEDITIGWLVVNIWHNAQYILFVWMFNAKRYKGGVEPERRLVSWMSQPKNVGWYFVICIGLSTTIYLSIAGALTYAAIVPAIVVYMTINFHHYVVDAMIWKKKSFKAAKAT